MAQGGWNKGKPGSTKRRDGEPNASTTGGPGPRNVDMSNWRQKMKEERVKFDDDRKEVFLNHFRQRNRLGEAAKAAGVTGATVRKHLENDPDFFEAFEEARLDYKDQFMDHVQNLMLEGIREPIFGGQFKDEEVGQKVTYPTNLIAMEMRRVEPEYKERVEIDAKVQGGVLAVPADAGMSVAEWAAKYGKPAPTDETTEESE